MHHSIVLILLSLFTLNQFTLNLSQAQTLGSYDLVWDSLDANGFPLNPRWGKQELYRQRTGKSDYWNQEAFPHARRDCLDFAKRPGWWLYDHYNAFAATPQCTTQPTFIDNPAMGKCPMNPYVFDYHISGHVNWRTVTYDGALEFVDASAWWMNPDTDWSVNLVVPNAPGTTGSDGLIHMEWRPTEIGNNFKFGWWKLVKDQVEAGFVSGDTVFNHKRSKIKQQKLLDPIFTHRRAIASGLFGLDMGHEGAESELHPVFAIAVHSGGTRAPDGVDLKTIDLSWDKPENLNDDIWSVFFINWGQEGYCSSGKKHALGVNTYKFSIPWVKGMTKVELLTTTRFYMDGKSKKVFHPANWNAQIDPGNQSLIIELTLPDAKERTKVYGDLHLKWHR